MSRSYDNEKKPSQSTFSFKPTASFLQTRPFAPVQTDLDEDATPRPSGYTENFLEKIINQRGTESSDTPVQPKRMNRLQTLQAKRMSMIQAKLSIGEPNDKYEQEADATAARVVQQINSPTQDKSVQREAMEEEEELQMKPISSIQREAMEEEEELQMKPISSIQREESMVEEEEELQMKSLVQRRENLGGGEASTDLESSIQSARGSGQSLDSSLQLKMGQAMGADFSGVKVHTDSQADQLNQSIQAKAFTTGQDVFFRQGSYNPSSTDGQELIAHELTHVVQQNGGAVQRSPIPQPHSATEFPVVQRAFAPATITAGKNVRLHDYKIGSKAHFWSPRVGNQTTKVDSSGIETLQDNAVIEADNADTFIKPQTFGGAKNFTKARSQAGNVGYVKTAYFTVSDRVGATNFYAVTTGPGVFRFYDYQNHIFLGNNHPNGFKVEAITILNHVLTAENATNVEVAKKDELIEKILHTASLGASPIDPNMWGTAVGNIQGKIIPRLNAENANLIAAGLITANHTLKKVEFTGADFHKNGQMPVFCIFDTDGVNHPADPRKIVYKPGNLAVDRTLYNRVGSLASALDPTGDQIPTYTLIDGVDARLGQNNEHFTLMEFVKSAVPTNTADLTGVWASIGANAAMAYAVGLEDMHNENILLLKDRIQVIDMEATTGRFTTFSAMLWNKAINEGIRPKLEDAARNGILASGTTQGQCTGAAQSAFKDTLDRYQNVGFDADFVSARDTLAGSHTRLVPIATADLYKGIIAARNRGSLPNWINWLNNAGDYYVDECKGQTGSTKAFILNVLRSPGTYNALVRGDVPYYSRDLGTSDIFDEEGNQIDETGCSKVARAINDEMDDRSDDLIAEGDGNMDQTAAYTAFDQEIIPLLISLNNDINAYIP